jgi:hypothetical protein
MPDARSPAVVARSRTVAPRTRVAAGEPPSRPRYHSQVNSNAVRRRRRFLSALCPQSPSRGSHSALSSSVSCVSVRAHSSTAAPTPQNLTYGRRPSGWHQNSSSSRSSGSEGRDHSLSRRVAARTLCGPPTENRQDRQRRDGVTPCRVANRVLRPISALHPLGSHPG